MAESIVTQRAKARERTQRYRERLRGRRIPEARVVDHAMLQAILHLKVTGELRIAREDWIEVVQATDVILRRRHDRQASLHMVAERTVFQAKGEWLEVARKLEANPPSEEVARLMAEQKKASRRVKE